METAAFFGGEGWQSACAGCAQSYRTGASRRCMSRKIPAGLNTSEVLHRWRRFGARETAGLRAPAGHLGTFRARLEDCTLEHASFCGPRSKHNCLRSTDRETEASDCPHSTEGETEAPEGMFLAQVHRAGLETKPGSPAATWEIQDPEYLQRAFQLG